MPSTWSFQFVYCNSHIFITCTFIVSNCEVWEYGCISNLELKTKEQRIIWSHTHFRARPFCPLTHPYIHHTHFLAFLLLICLLQVWLMSGAYNCDLLCINHPFTTKAKFSGRAKIAGDQFRSILGLCYSGYLRFITYSSRQKNVSVS